MECLTGNLLGMTNVGFAQVSSLQLNNINTVGFDHNPILGTCIQQGTDQFTCTGGIDTEFGTVAIPSVVHTAGLLIPYASGTCKGTLMLAVDRHNRMLSTN